MKTNSLLPVSLVVLGVVAASILTLIAQTVPPFPDPGPKVVQNADGSQSVVIGNTTYKLASVATVPILVPVVTPAPIPPVPPVVELWWDQALGSLTTNMHYVVHKSPVLLSDKTQWPVYATIQVTPADVSRTNWSTVMPAVADGNYYIVELVNASATRPSSVFSVGAVPRDEPAPNANIPMGIRIP